MDVLTTQYKKFYNVAKLTYSLWGLCPQPLPQGSRSTTQFKPPNFKYVAIPLYTLTNGSVIMYLAVAQITM